MKVEMLSLLTPGRSLIPWKDWFSTRRQGKGKLLMKTLGLHIIVTEPSQYMFNLHKYISRMNIILVEHSLQHNKEDWKCIASNPKFELQGILKCISPLYSRWYTFYMPLYSPYCIDQVPLKAEGECVYKTISSFCTVVFLLLIHQKLD